MGITIHWEGSVEDEKTVKESIEFVKQFAHALGLEYQEYEDVGVVVEDKVYSMETGELIYKWISFYRDCERHLVKEDDILEESVCLGVMVNFPEPVNIETFDFNFFKHGKKWLTRGFCKTQVFSGEEIYNLYAHIVLISMLTTIKHTWIPNLEIHDEALFYLPIDEKEKKKYIDDYVADEYKDYYMNLKPFNFKELAKAHGALSKLIHLTAEALRNVGCNVDVGVRFDQTNLNDFI